MEQSPTNLDSTLASGVTHQHTPNQSLTNDSSENAYITSDVSETSRAFCSQQTVNIQSNNSRSQDRTTYDIKQLQQQDIPQSSHAVMFDQASTATNSYNHSLGIFGSNPANLHGNLSVMNSSLEMKPSLQSLPAHPFYSYPVIAPPHDEGAAQRPGVSPMLGNPMGYRGYSQINDFFPARPEFYAQQAPFGHPQYW